MELKAKGKGFLKVTGILMIIGGGLSILLGLLLLFLVGFFTESITKDTNVTALALGSAIICIAILFIGSILELVVGIVGVNNANKPEHSLACVIWGIIVLIPQVISLVMFLLTMASRMEVWTIIVICITTIAIPVLFLIGAGINRSNYKKWKATVKTIEQQAKNKPEPAAAYTEPAAPVEGQAPSQDGNYNQQ